MEAVAAAVVHGVTISELGWVACGAQFWTPPRHQQEMAMANNKIEMKMEFVSQYSKNGFVKNWRRKEGRD